MKYVILLGMLFNPIYASDFENYTGFYAQNHFFYSHYLSSDLELTDLGRLHLLGLKFLIDLRLGDMEACTNDSDKIFEITSQDPYMYKEFTRKYLP